MRFTPRRSSGLTSKAAGELVEPQHKSPHRAKGRAASLYVNIKQNSHKLKTRHPCREEKKESYIFNRSYTG